MLASKFCVRTVCGFNGTFTDQTKTNFTSSLSVQLCFRFSTTTKRCPHPNSLLLSCKSSRRRFVARNSGHADHHDHDFLQASVLLPETMLHYRMRRQGFLENMKWQSSSSNQLVRFPFRAKQSRDYATSIGQHFLRRFQSPTIFLKISCDGDFLLPIIVGDFAVEKLFDAFWGDDNGDCPDQFQFVRNLVDKLGYEVNMVRLTERVVNTYFAKLYLNKPGKNDIISLDVRPSDAINVANRCKAPIYVSKQIVLSDAIRIGYGMSRGRDSKPTYDVYLDSATEGPDSVAKELDLVRSINRAVKEERYSDAAKLRDKLLELRKSENNY